MPATGPVNIVASTDITDAETKMTTRPDGPDASTLPSILADMGVIGTSTADEEEEEAEEHFEISIVQKMLSAVVGSVLTSLLGMLQPCQRASKEHVTLTRSSVTPLDVVRVRLQSQHRPAPVTHEIPRFSAHSAPPSFSNLPPNLGVTACCREVFWVNNNASFCVAGATSATSAPEVQANLSIRNPNATAAIAAECAVEETQRRTINSTMDGLRKIARHEGLSTLWRGLSPTLVMAVPANVIYLAGYDWLRSSRASPLRRARVSDASAPLVAGSCARVLAALAVSPVELFRTRMQARPGGATGAGGAGSFRETLAGVREMVERSGYRSLWRGLGLTLWRDVPFSALYWWGYEAGRDGLAGWREGREEASGTSAAGSRNVPRRRTAAAAGVAAARGRQSHGATLVDSFVAGGVSGALASIVTTPFDVGKTRQQVLQQEQAAASSSTPRTSTAATAAVRPEDRSMPRFLWHIFKEEGAAGLFRGWVPRTLKVAPACAIMISSYEVGKKMAASSKAAAVAAAAAAAAEDE